MSSVSHTPGPWLATLDETPDAQLGVFQDDGTGNGSHIKLVPGDPESDANLRLISASPELLSALKAFLAWSQDPESESSDKITDCVEAARVAIAKAEGVS